MKFAKWISMCEVVPKGYGVVYHSVVADRTLCMIFPLNWIARWGHSFYWAIISPHHPTKRELHDSEIVENTKNSVRRNTIKKFVDAARQQIKVLKLAADFTEDELEKAIYRIYIKNVYKLINDADELAGRILEAMEPPDEKD